MYCKGVITLNPCSGTRHHKNSPKNSSTSRVIKKPPYWWL
ncbi:hypothetical protein HMPREF3203_00563 [Proteus mirabilis]|nr:hypothetical protein HMPREF3203_00563 [Proteus mirabilis]